MGLTKGSWVVNTIHSLADIVTNQATAIKTAFDKAAADIKTYINDTLTVEIEAQFTTKTEITDTRKLSATGDFTGTLNGAAIVAAEPGLSSTVAAHLADSVYITSFAGVSKSGTECAAAIQTAFDTIGAAAGGTVKFAKGTYKVNTALI